MSLVHDALEKAKREAAAKSARDLGLPESRVGAGQPFRARRTLPPTALFVGGAAVALVAVATWGILARSGDAPFEESARPAAPSTAAPASSPPVAAPAAPAGSPEAASEPSAATTVATAPPPGAVVEPDVAVPATDSVSPAPTTPVSAPVTTPATAPAFGTTSATGPSAPRRPADAAASAAKAGTAASFVRQTTLADGTVVKLGGIAWSEAAPLAYLNGKLYAKGESVAGLLIERIERERVVLAGGDGRIVLTLK